MENPSKILVVDDDSIIRDILQVLLEDEGYFVSTAEDGLQGIEFLLKYPVDLIITDYMMPNLTGYQLCCEIRKHEKLKHIPIIVLTQLDDDRILVKCLDGGADDFLNKPFNRSELKARVRSMLRIKRQHDELQMALNMREDLATMIVHDQRGMLTRLFLQINLLEKNAIVNNIYDVFKKSITTLEDHTSKLIAFTNDLLFLAKLKSGKLVLNTEEYDICQIIEKEVFDHKEIVALRDIDLSFEVKCNVPVTLRIDKNLFKRMLDNFISNSVKFSKPNTKVILRLVTLDVKDSTDNIKNIVLQVIDEGPGIPKEDRDRIFNQFEIAPLKKKGVNQTGIGLAFCRMVADSHEWKIYITENKPKGSIFNINFGNIST